MGSSSKLGGIESGDFFSTKNSSEVFLLLGSNASLTELQFENRIELNISKIRNFILFNIIYLLLLSANSNTIILLTPNVINISDTLKINQ